MLWVTCDHEDFVRKIGRDHLHERHFVWFGVVAIGRSWVSKAI